MKSFRSAIAHSYFGARADQSASGIGFQERDLPTESRRQGDIVLILPGNVFPTRKRDAAVECGGDGIHGHTGRTQRLHTLQNGLFPFVMAVRLAALAAARLRFGANAGATEMMCCG